MSQPAPHAATSSNTRPLALITGASSGIGREMALVFAREGYDLLLTARNREQLENTAGECKVIGGRAEVIPGDLASPAFPQELFDEVQRRGRPLDALVNNAGFGTLGPFADAEPRSQLDMLQVNVVAFTHLTRLFLPQMVQRRAGRILNVASTAAFQPGPLMAVYYASKAYVLWFSEALDSELSGSGVTVTALCPGPTRTDFQHRARMEGRLSRDRVAMDARAVAEAGFAAMRKGRRLCIPGFLNRLGAFAVRFAPRKLVVDTARRLNRPG